MPSRPFDPRTWSRFGRVLLVITIVALGIRVAYVVGAKLDEGTNIGDQIFYNAAANRLAWGDGFVEPFDPHPPPLLGSDPAADHPPLTIVVLAPVSLLTDDSPNAHRFTMVAFGTATVVLLGLLGRALAGDRAGLIAAGIAAINPNLWVNDGLIMSESLTALVVTVALLLTYRVLRAPSVKVALWLGLVCGLAALTRAELVLLVPGLLIPAALLARSVPRNTRLRLAAAGTGVAVAVMLPWVVYNMSRFDEPVFLSTNDGIALLGSNCETVYYGADTGLTDLNCLKGNPPGDQSSDSRIYRDRALDYMSEHKGRAVVVTLARVGRTWSVFRPLDMLDYNEGEARERWVTSLGLIVYYPLVLLAVYGVVVARRKRITQWPLLVPMLIVTIASAATYGQTRFRVPAEPSLVILGAIGLAALVTARPASQS
ncbi:MAG TPA: glycosyltransferase family 39 protein [Acidimicrobiia bacterium]|nr:glycosyltransferase family 39 protein [Acidimicrobiia bacterium]